MQSLRHSIEEKRSYLRSLLTVPILAAVGVNLVSSGLVGLLSVRTLIIAFGIAIVLMSLLVALFTWPSANRQVSFKTGVFIELDGNSRVRVVSHKHFDWADSSSLESWDKHIDIVTLLPQLTPLSYDQRRIISDLLFRLILDKWNKLSSDWCSQLEKKSEDTTNTPIVSKSPAPVILSERTLRHGTMHIFELHSWKFGRCRITVDATSNSVQRVNVSPVFAFARSDSTKPNGNLFALTAQVECTVVMSRWSWLFGQSKTFADWFESITKSLESECSYSNAIVRLQELILFELFRRTEQSDSKVGVMPIELPLRRNPR